jgi:queuine tRNA-ribosyltransferase
MSQTFHFSIQKRSSEAPLARVGTIHTPHGDVLTPAFIPVGTKATVKAVDVETLHQIGAQAVLANTYHLCLQPGQEVVHSHGGFGAMMNWRDASKCVLPTFTDSGGFQVLSLGAAFDTGVSKIATSADISRSKQHEETDAKGEKKIQSTNSQMAKVDEEGVTFKSFLDGSIHRFTPELSMQIQHDLGADIFFAFDECTSPLSPREYQVSAMGRTHRWAERCLVEHQRLGVSSATGEQQALYGVVQGGAYPDLRRESAQILGAMEFDGYGIGGSFTKDDMDATVRAATEVLPEGKPRHLLGIGEPIDFFLGVEYGIDTFDCVTPTRLARHGNIYSPTGKVNMRNGKFRSDLSPVCSDPSCPAHVYTKSYLSHLYHSGEMLAASIASAHNLHFLITLVEQIRQSLLDDRFYTFKKEFCDTFYGSNVTK